MGAMSPLQEDHPMMVAWEAFKGSDDARSAMFHAQVIQISPPEWGSPSGVQVDHPRLEGSLWAVFRAGFNAGVDANNAATAKAFQGRTD